MQNMIIALVLRVIRVARSTPSRLTVRGPRAINDSPGYVSGRVSQRNSVKLFTTSRRIKTARKLSLAKCAVIIENTSPISAVRQFWHSAMTRVTVIALTSLILVSVV